MTGHASIHTDPVADRLARIGRSPNLLIVAGALSVVIGLLALSWPGATVAVAWLFAIQLLVAGGVLQAGSTAPSPS